MTYGTLCSGIEAPSVAWGPLGWTPAYFAETDPYCSALLQHHYPGVLNLGDVADVTAPLPAVDVLIAGTPCQSFSVAGRRADLDDSRGNLTLEYLRVVEQLRPRWVVWENVPGVLSIDAGRTFGAILGTLGECGYGFAYRVLDAQHWGVPQRRRRVFVVGCLGDWRGPAAVLFERHSLRRDIKTRGGTKEAIAGTPGGSSQSGGFRTTDLDNNNGAFVLAFGGNNRSGPIEVATPVTSKGGAQGPSFNTGTFITHPVPILEAGGRTGRAGTDDIRAGLGVGDPGDPMYTLQGGKQHAIAFTSKDWGQDAGENIAPTLRSMTSQHSHPNGGGQVAIAFTERTRKEGRNFECQEGLAYALTNPGSGGRTHSRSIMAPGLVVRRLTPLECERLQGFYDGYTLIPYRGKPASDSARYKALGNSMAVPVVRWIGERIEMVEFIRAHRGVAS